MPMLSVLTSPTALGSLAALPLLFVIMGLFPRKNQFPLEGRTFLITGASQGMGRGLSRLAAQRGAHVILVARNVAKLEAAVAYVSQHARSASQRFTHISADVTKPEENARLLREATAWNGGRAPDVVWANAGVAYPRLFAETTPDGLREHVELDYLAGAYLARETILLWTSREQHTPAGDKAGAAGEKKRTRDEELARHFIVTSSVVAFTGLAGYGPYSPAKAALRNLSDTLRNELALYNGAREHATRPAGYAPMKNHIVFPAGILSPGFDEENKLKHAVTKLLEEDDVPQSEDEVAAAAFAGLERGEYLVTSTFLGRLLKSTALASSTRNGWGVVDTLLSWVMAVVWLFIGPGLERKVFDWGKQNGAPEHAS